jgi:hypothetical protein
VCMRKGLLAALVAGGLALAGRRCPTERLLFYSVRS